MATESELMFHGYSVQPTSRRSPAAFNRSTASVSPYCYSSDPQPVSSTDLSLLAHQFSQQSIRYDPWSATTAYSSPASQQRQITESSTGYYHSSQTLSDCSHLSTRSQRQAHTRLQCQPAHRREINSLVDRMVATGEQCFICSPSAEDYASTPSVDEEADDMGDLDFRQPDRPGQTLSYRRSSDFSKTPNYVAKSIRVRKARRQKSQPSR